MTVSRRGLFRLAALAMLGARTTAPLHDETSRQRYVIPFEYALDHPEAPKTRQAYVDQEVLRILGPVAYEYVNNKFMYDHDGSLVNAATHTTDEIILKDPRFIKNVRKYLEKPKVMKELVDEYTLDPMFARFGTEEREARIKEFLSSDAGFHDALKRMQESVEKTKAENFMGYTIYNLFDMGMRNKADTFIEAGVFKKNDFGVIVVEPNQVTVDATIVHEYRHAMDYKNGVLLVHPSGIVMINHENVQDIDACIMHGVMQTRGLKDGWDFARRHNESAGRTANGFHPAYLGETIDFGDELRKFRALVDTDLDAFSKRIWKMHMESMKPFIGETKSVMDAVGIRYKK